MMSTSINVTNVSTETVTCAPTKTVASAAEFKQSASVTDRNTISTGHVLPMYVNETNYEAYRFVAHSTDTRPVPAPMHGNYAPPYYVQSTVNLTSVCATIHFASLASDKTVYTVVFACKL